MNLTYILFILVLSIGFIVWATAFKKLNAVFALLIAAMSVGILSDLPLNSLASVLKTGFGNTMGKIGLLIILGTTLGVILEKSGATVVMANAILKAVHERNAPLAISLAGFIVGLPIFCDSGYIILSGLNHSLVSKTKFSMPVMAGALATSLYSVHCLVPPHPGITAAVATLGGDVGLVILWGTALAAICTAIGYIWSITHGARFIRKTGTLEVESQARGKQLPGAILSFTIIFFPIALIASKPVVQLLYSEPDIGTSPMLRVIDFLGEPVMALGAGTILSLTLVRSKDGGDVRGWLSLAVERSATILAITAAGGMFGEMIDATGLGKGLGASLRGMSLAIFLPFVVAAILKTAQGSSTVAIITASSLLAPMLPDLGFVTPGTLTLALLSMGAGSMMVSHANDSYFWVVSKFSGLEIGETLRVYSIATVLMALSAQLIVWAVYSLI